MKKYKIISKDLKTGVKLNLTFHEEATYLRFLEDAGSMNMTIIEVKLIIDNQ